MYYNIFFKKIVSIYKKDFKISDKKFTKIRKLHLSRRHQIDQKILFISSCMTMISLDKVCGPNQKMNFKIVNFFLMLLNFYTTRLTPKILIVFQLA